MNEKCFCHLTDEKTGECFFVKDKSAREQISALREQLNTLLNILNELDNNYATDEDVSVLQGQINSLSNIINGLDDKYATDSDVTQLDEQIKALNNNITSLSDAIATNTSNISEINNTITDVEHVSIVYDKETDGSYTSGLVTGSYNFDVSIYKRLYVVADLNYSSASGYIDLTYRHSGGNYEGWIYGALVNDANAGQLFKCAKLTVPSSKNNINVSAGFFKFSNGSFSTGNNSYKIVKIYGIK